MKKSKTTVIAAMILAAAMSLSGCGGTPETGSSTPASSAAQTTDSSAASEGAATGDTPAAPAADDGKDYSYQLNEDGSIAMSYGAILHAWSWSFKTITENLQAIKDAGYTSIQTSPINECKIGEDGGMTLYGEGTGKWYYHYQPTDYKIGNYQLGTEEEFKTLCEEAKKLGLKIIVDVPLNHVSSDMSVVSDNIKNLCDEPFHNEGEITSYSSRKQVTQGDLLGLHDLNTQDKAVQQYELDYLKQCVADGASGFRFDAAKHIELPDDKESFASDFWPTVLDNGAEFQYGEILQGETDRIDAYSEMMSVTASNYGDAIRRACLGNLSVSNVSSYGSSKVDESKFVTWVESHDNYCNDGSWENYEESEIEYGWAVIAARAGGAPLFFSRPAGSSTDDQWGNNKIGEVGDDGFKSANVSALNHFRNDMAGLGETLSNPDADGRVLMIERGDKGAVIINAKDSEFALDAASVLSDGTYTDKVSGAEFTVSGGKISGKIPANGIAVVY